jgi:hypothetical protein
VPTTAGNRNRSTNFGPQAEFYHGNSRLRISSTAGLDETSMAAHPSVTLVTMVTVELHDSPPLFQADGTSAPASSIASPFGRITNMDHPQLTDGHRPVTSSSRRLGAVGSEKKEGERLITPAGHEYANTAFRPAGHRRRHAHRAGGGSGGGWGVATLTATPSFYTGCASLGHRVPRHRRPTDRPKPGHRSAQLASCYCGLIATTPRAETRPSRPTGGRLGQIRPPEQASRTLIPFRFTN